MKTGIILAAGRSTSFDIPTCLLEFDGISLIKRTIGLLENNGIKDIVVVVGYGKEKVMDHLKGRGITFIENSEYDISGTMSSLAKTASIIHNDFLLVEGDLLYEESIIERVIAQPQSNIIVCARLSGSGDEAFIECDEHGNLLKISKDIRQMNRLNAEMVGISRISFSLFLEMMSLYQNNENILLNYEYLLERASLHSSINCLIIDGLVWSDIDDQTSYEFIKNRVFPQIKSRESNYKLDYAQEKIKEILDVSDTDIQSFGFAGGMTNSNFKAVVKGKELFLRIPGKCTEVLISRENESHNSQLVSELGINTETIYCNIETGIKITKAIPSAETLTSRAGRLPKNMKEVAMIIKKLHLSQLTFTNIFSGLDELNKYEELCNKLHVVYYDNYKEVKNALLALYEEVQNTIGLDLRPCHNDLVPENFVRSGNNNLYLLDWEYAGLNDPAWDLAAYINECGLSDKETELFLSYYYGDCVNNDQDKKIMMYRIFQDILWSVWTLAKEAKGDDFGSYGRERFERASVLLKEVTLFD